MKRILFVLFCYMAVSVVAQPRYVFYLIGDGMGANQVLAAEMYKAELQGKINRDPLCMTQFPFSGTISTFSESNGITDSAAAGTALATGKKTKNGTLGMSSSNVPLTSIAEQFHLSGWAVGIGTSVAIDHATPGAFYAHVPNRNNYYEIGTQLPKSGFEFFGGAGFHQPDNKSEWKAPNLYDNCEANGYKFAHSADEAYELMKYTRNMILVQEKDGIDRTAKSESIPYAIDRTEKDLSLADITRTGIHFLRNFDRFFLMIEGGKIDYACHGNDGATAIREVLDFDESVRLAYEFYLEHPDETLIIVTADHETGGFALANSDYTLNLQILQHQHVSSWQLGQQIRELHKTYGKKLKWEQIQNLFEKDLDFYKGVEISEKEDKMLHAAYKKLMSGKQNSTKTLYHNIDELGGTAIRILNRRAKLGWTTYGHSASAVPVFAIGWGAEKFVGWHDNSEIVPLILEIAQP